MNEDLIAAVHALIDWACDPRLALIAAQVGMTGPDTLIAAVEAAIAKEQER